MKLTIFGATGRIGGHLLNWAVDAGHDVHVLARSPQALRPRDGLTVTGGDVLDPAAVAVVISGADAVLSAVGPKIRDNFHYTELLAPAAANIIDGMHKTGAHRLIAVSAAAAFIPEDPDKSWIAKQTQPRIFARTFADVCVHVDGTNYGVIEDLHQTIMHALAQYIRQSRMTPAAICSSVF